ncbi:hypothetical protein AU476_17070 [Cupriavidus sp. UYMSc13B]|nr:hypothetical protein AU476_17070 [Cupriavidus sp. UYMSc13B]
MGFEQLAALRAQLASAKAAAEPATPPAPSLIVGMRPAFATPTPARRARRRRHCPWAPSSAGCNSASLRRFRASPRQSCR